MAGLVAIVSHDSSRAVATEDLDALVVAFTALRGDGVVRTASVGDHARCALIEGDVPGTSAVDGEAWAMVAGRPYVAGPLLGVQLDEFDGQFAGVRGDAGAGTFEVFNDPFGMFALHVAERDQRTYVSTSAAVLARHLRAPADPLGVALFLRTGRQFGPATHWRGVRRLGPATRIAFTPRPVESTYWRPAVDERARRMTLTQTADHCAQALLSTLEPRFAGASCLGADLTGGFDSRMMTAALARLGIPFATHTSGDHETVDVRIAREVAMTGDFPWHQERLPEGWTPDAGALRAALGWGDGSLDVLQLAAVMRLQEERARTCRRTVSGGGGEHFGHQPWVHEFLRAGRSRTIDYGSLMRMRVLTTTDMSGLRADPTPAVEDYAREVLAQAARPFAKELNTTQLDAVYVQRTVGHFGAFRSAAEAHLTAEMPAYFKPVFTAGFSANHRYRNGHALHRTIIGRIDPALGAVETERGGPAQRMRPGNAHRFLPYYVRLGRTAVRKVRGRSPAARAEGTAEAGQRRALQALRQDGTLDPSTMRTRELYDAGALRALLERADQPGFDGWETLGRVLTVELALAEGDGAGLSALPA